MAPASGVDSVSECPAYLTLASVSCACLVLLSALDRTEPGPSHFPPIPGGLAPFENWILI